MIISILKINTKASRRGHLRYPHEVSEFEIQAFLFASLRQMGYHVRGEVSTANQVSRFDLVVYANNNEATRVIEVKKDHKDHARKQVLKYSQDYGVPVDCISSMDDAARYLLAAQEILGDPHGFFPLAVMRTRIGPVRKGDGLSQEMAIAISGERGWQAHRPPVKEVGFSISGTTADGVADRSGNLLPAPGVTPGEPAADDPVN